MQLTICIPSKLFFFSKNKIEKTMLTLEKAQQHYVVNI